MLCGRCDSAVSYQVAGKFSRGLSGSTVFLSSSSIACDKRTFRNIDEKLSTGQLHELRCHWDGMPQN
jgi:hypothetical protein